MEAKNQALSRASGPPSVPVRSSNSSRWNGMPSISAFSSVRPSFMWYQSTVPAKSFVPDLVTMLIAAPDMLPYSAGAPIPSTCTSSMIAGFVHQNARPVSEEVVSRPVDAPGVRGHARAECGQRSAALGSLADSGRHRDQIPEVPVGRQILDEVRREAGTHAGTRDVENRRRGDRDFLLHGLQAEFDLQVDRRRDADPHPLHPMPPGNRRAPRSPRSRRPGATR